MHALRAARHAKAGREGKNAFCRERRCHKGNMKEGNLAHGRSRSTPSSRPLPSSPAATRRGSAAPRNRAA